MILNDKMPRVYFLGAKSSSMIIIEKLIKTHDKDAVIKNNKIKGRARISDYHNEYMEYSSKDYKIIGIEVDDDSSITKYEYINISQFNPQNQEYNGKSSLRIICEYLKVDSSKYEDIILNEEKYIYGLLDKYGNSKSGKRIIKKIRIKDIKNQGTNLPRWKYFKTSRKLKQNNAGNYRDTIIIKSKSEIHAITIDALYLNLNKKNLNLKNILIYNIQESDNKAFYNLELCLYSKNKITIVDDFKEKIEEQFSNLENIVNIDFYSTEHYVGTVITCDKSKDKSKEAELHLKHLNHLNEAMYHIRNVLDANPYIINENQSIHIFSFPFKLDCCAKRKNSLEKRWNIDTINEHLENNDWQKDEAMNLIYDDSDVFALDSDYAYNEYCYFYPNAREAIFDANKSKENLVRNYKKSTLGNNAEYIINVPIYKNNKLDPFHLQLFDIRLKIYGTGVGVLSFFLKYDYKDANDRFIIEKNDGKISIFDKVNIINEFGRRIYPQFISNGLDFPKSIFLANNISINLDDDDNPITEPFEYTAKYTKSGNVVGSHILNILGKDFTCSPINKEKVNKKCIHITPVIDDRMHVSCYMFDKSNILKEISENNSSGKGLSEKRIKNAKLYTKLTNDKKLYNNIYIEPDGPTCQSDTMLEEMLNNSIYTRWINYGTLYAFSEYSFISIIHSDIWEATNLFTVHFCTMYYEMMCLCLMQSATINSFEEEVTNISLNKHYDSEQISQVSERFIQFNSSLYFRQVTAQEQGKEMYDQMQDIMNIEKNLNELRRDIEDLQNTASLKESKSTNNALSLLAVIGGLFTIPNFFVSLVGAEDELHWYNDIVVDRFYLYGIPLVLGIVAIFIYIITAKRARRLATIFIIVLAVLMLFYMTFIVFNTPIIEFFSPLVEFLTELKS